MKENFLQLIKGRRSIYTLGKSIDLSEKELIQLIENTAENLPSAFNSQSSRVVILLGKHHDKLWTIVKNKLKSMISAEAFEQTNSKIDHSFLAGYGTVLFFEDQATVKNLQESFPSYQDMFPVWSEHSAGLNQFAIWTALAENQIGASLQHYNPLIDNDVKDAWNLPQEWVLKAQMPFGSIEAPAGEKTFIDTETRFKVFAD